jgi:hypothetical protein
MACETAKRQIWNLREATSFLEGQHEVPATAVTSPNSAVIATTRRWTSLSVLKPTGPPGPHGGFQDP